MAGASGDSESIHRRVSTVKQGNVAPVALNESDVASVDVDQFQAVAPVAFCDRVSEAPSYEEESKQGGTSIKTIAPVEMSFSDLMVGDAAGELNNLNDAQLWDEYGEESRSEEDEDEEGGELGIQISGKGLATQHSMKSSSVVDMERPVTVQVTFQGSLVPISKKAQVITSHPSMTKTRSGKVFKGGAAADGTLNRMATEI